MYIWKSGSRHSGKGPADWFTGAVRIDPLVEAQSPARSNAAHVTFESGARTAWHTHPLGQVLIITFGQGLVQSWGSEARIVRPGDVIHFAPHEKHWHGASAETAMSHIAINEALDGQAVDWMEHVSAAQFESAATAA